jgi:hypothetical protein
MSRFAIFVHNPDGDSGCGRIVGGIGGLVAAEAKAASIRRAAERAGHDVEAIVLPMVSGETSAREVARQVATETEEWEVA